MATQISSLTSTDRSLVDRNLLSHFGHGPIIPVPHGLVHKAFESIVDAHPAVIAAKFGEKTITYQQLDIAANRLAHHLIDSGLRPQQRVCLVVQRSFEMLIGILAILKAGCQYVPVDGGVASEQALQHIFTDTEARFILCLPRFWDKIRQHAKPDAIVLALEANTGAFYSTERPKVEVSSADGAYAIYTSGKTSILNMHYLSDMPCRKHWATKGCRCFSRERHQRLVAGAGQPWHQDRFGGCTSP